MPNRSRSPPPPPHIASLRGRIHSPERHHSDMPRARIDRREFRPVISSRRSRSLSPPKKRSFSPPPLKRKPSPNREREREIPRRPKVSKSPVGARVVPERYSVREPEPHLERSVARSDRFKERDYVEDKVDRSASERSLPQFRGAEGAVDFANEDLKKFTVEIVRRPPGGSSGVDLHVNRSVAPPSEEIVRRPGVRGRGQYRGSKFRGQYDNHHIPPPHWLDQESDQHQNEGSRPPIFNLRAEISASSSKDRSTTSDEYRRIVNINNTSRVPGHERERSRERVRYSSPGPSYEDNRKPQYYERERSPYETRRRSPPRDEYIEPREKRERRAGSREDMRVREVEGRRREEVEVRRREERTYSHDRASFERESDLRTRLNERRTEPRPDEREQHSTRHYEVERQLHHSTAPPPREKRRPASPERHEVSRSGRTGSYEREKESRRRERPHSREREVRSRDRDRYEHSDYHESDKSRRPPSHKTEFEPPTKFYKTVKYDEKVFVPQPTRGRGGPPIRRGMPPMMRGRGIPRMNRGFPRMPRGGPRFMPMPRFPPPRKSAY